MLLHPSSLSLLSIVLDNSSHPGQHWDNIGTDYNVLNSESEVVKYTNVAFETDEGVLFTEVSYDYVISNID